MYFILFFSRRELYQLEDRLAFLFWARKSKLACEVISGMKPFPIHTLSCSRTEGNVISISLRALGCQRET
jgi:hypothetical protein